MATEKQIAANRRNSLNSTGPRTPEGKAASSRNAVKYDLHDRRFILASECPERYETFRQEFYDDYMPTTATETALVDIMAAARWRIVRMDGFEAAILDHESRQETFESGNEPEQLPMPVRTGLAWRRTADSGRSTEMMNRTLARLQQQFNGAFDRLERMRKEANRQRRRDEKNEISGCKTKSILQTPCAPHNHR